MTRRGASLIEAVLVVVLLALAVPPALRLMEDVAAGRADAVNAVRAATLASGVLETVLADVALGGDVLSDMNGYLQTPTTGLQARLALLAGPYEAVGLSYAVAASGLVDATGLTSGDPDRDVYRIVTVTVEFPAARGGRIAAPMSVMAAAEGLR